MSRKLKLLALVNVAGWVVVVPLLAGTVLRSFVHFDGRAGTLLPDRPFQAASLADVFGTRAAGGGAATGPRDAVASGIRSRRARVVPAGGGAGAATAPGLGGAIAPVGVGVPADPPRPGPADGRTDVLGESGGGVRGGGGTGFPPPADGGTGAPGPVTLPDTPALPGLPVTPELPLVPVTLPEPPVARPAAALAGPSTGVRRDAR